MIEWYKKLPQVFYSEVNSVPFRGSEIFLWNEDLGKQFAISACDLKQEHAGLAMAYAGHQFGHFNLLGDGRAMLLNEVKDKNKVLFDLHLKGSGPTPYSRRGDGLASRSAMVREFIVSECMHALGIQTSRSLFVIDTHETIVRQNIEQGGVLGRLSKSLIRVGTFEFARAVSSAAEFKIFADSTIERLYPELCSQENPYLELLRRVRDEQIALVVQWMRVGFIHGVMNTDNMSIAGETIDYGPCAFLNAYDENKVYSSIDRDGRYAFGRQPAIAQWNLWAFAHSLLPLIHEKEQVALEMAREVIAEFPDIFAQAYYTMMCSKLGMTYTGEEKKKVFVEETLSFLQSNEIDYTEFFRGLTHNREFQFKPNIAAKFEPWKMAWNALRLDNQWTHVQSEKIMLASNPNAIPRNAWVEEMIHVSRSAEEIQEALVSFKHALNSYEFALEFEKEYRTDRAEYQTFCGT